ncbi:MAG: MoxR family ATPase [Armatimonadetes bacterium]|nr:MoxR family ATPase [Armatimonadota bacterium]
MNTVESTQSEHLQSITEAVAEVEKVIVGKRRPVELALTALLCNGHCLVEDVPGVGKTMLSRALAAATGCSFKRIQFTPDLLPSDVTGTSVFNQATREFEFRPGPVFANVLLADEINRATPKCQAALLECMEEGQVTSDGQTFRLPEPFFVIATQNNVEMQGTYPLPEAQLDRFLIRIDIGYPSKDDEIHVLERQVTRNPIDDVRPVLSQAKVLALQSAVRKVHVAPELSRYIVDVVAATRARDDVALGASPRGSLNLMRASQAWALMQSRDYAIPDDVKVVAGPVLAHRLILRPHARRLDAAGIIADVLSRTPIDRE